MKKLNYVDTLDTASEEDDQYDYEEVAHVMTILRVGTKQEKSDVQITPTDHAQYRTKISWTVDSGAPMTMLSEKHLGWIF